VGLVAGGGFGPKRVKFPLFTTFDSFAPPQLQKRVSGKGWADVDLDGGEGEARRGDRGGEGEGPEGAARLIRLTSNGRGLAAVPEKSPSTGELHERILGKLDGPMARLLRPLLERYPNAMSNEDLAAAAGYSPTSTSYTNPRGALRSFGMVEYRDGGVAARSILFPTADHADEED
jgi:hypothetical protein